MDFFVRDFDMLSYVVRRYYNEGDGIEMVYEFSGVLNYYGNM